MKNTYRIIPTYTGDVSGIASALYEMGGLVVIHDPSGCNSTYNTHDETRWYDEDSLIYISGLSEIDAILGNDDKFIRDVVHAADAFKPAFIALVSSPVPYLNGTDFKGIARLIEKRTGICTFFVQSNGTHDYSLGVGEAFLQLAKGLFEDRIPLKNAVAGPVPKDILPAAPAGSLKLNILGLTPLDYDEAGTRAGLYKKLSDFEILSLWAMDNSLKDLKKAPLADVNLVVSVTGLKLAGYMWEKFHIPYVWGAPVGDFTDVLKRRLQLAAERQMPVESFEGPDPASEADGDPVYLIGEPLLMASLGEHIRIRYKKRAYVINPLETDCSPAHIKTEGEEDLEKVLKNAACVVADPLYKPILPAGVRFYPYSHEAFSGRCFRRERVDLFADSLEAR